MEYVTWYIIILSPIITALILRVVLKNKGCITITDLLFSMVVAILPGLREMMIISLYGENWVIYKKGENK